MPKSPKVRKESSKRERFPKREDPQAEAKGNKSKEMKTIIREIGEETAELREKNKELRKELEAVREKKG
jgi:hypothetical protein